MSPLSTTLILLVSIGLSVVQVYCAPHEKSFDPSKFIALEGRGKADYYLSIRSMRQMEAISECEERPSYQLATILSEEDTNDILMVLLDQDIKRAWIAGRTKGPIADSSFKWLTNPVGSIGNGYYNWGPSQPSISDPADWGQSGIAIEKQDVYWELHREDELFPALCQKIREF